MSASLPSVDDLIRELELQPHPEGGYYRETYRSDDKIMKSCLPERYGADRSVSTCIYYMLTADTFSVMHKVESDEIFHHYLGAPLEMLLLHPSGHSEIVIVGPDVSAGQRPQFVIRRGVWQGSRVLGGAAFTLIGATVAPGFDFADFSEGTRAELSAQFPEQAALIGALTRK